MANCLKWTKVKFSKFQVFQVCRFIYYNCKTTFPCIVCTYVHWLENEAACTHSQYLSYLFVSVSILSNDYTTYLKP